MTPDRFSVIHVSPNPGELTYWMVTDEMVERLILPMLGPTSYCLLRLLDRVLGDQPRIFDRVTFETATVADMIGVKPNTAFHALTRLRQFHMIEEDAIESTYEHPTFCFRRVVKPIGPKEWRRLPASIREQFSEVPI